MNNKEYKIARERAESAAELDTFVSYYGIFNRANRYMKPDDIKELRAEYKTDKSERAAFVLDDFGGRAVIIPTDAGAILKSYYTDVAEIRNGEFIKKWAGYSNTTLKHINAFRNHFGFDTISKREWIEM